MQYDSDHEYHSSSGYVYVGGDLAFELAAVWDGIEHAECAGMSLRDIHAALKRSWAQAVIALGRRNISALREILAAP